MDVIVKKSSITDIGAQNIVLHFKCISLFYSIRTLTQERLIMKPIVSSKCNSTLDNSLRESYTHVYF